MQFLRKAGRRLLCLAMMALLLAALLPNAAMAATASASATTMRVAGTEGTVTVKNGSGQKKSVFSNMQLYNGWTVETAAASYATLSLDSAKAVKLGAGTKVELRQNTSSKKLELFVSKGNLFFDVSDKLAEDETMNIRTTNMVCGIRGTMGEVEAVSSTCTVTYLLDGHTAIINTNDCFSPLTESGASGASGAAAAPTVQTDGETGTSTSAGYFTNLLAAMNETAGMSGETAPMADPTEILTVRSGDGRTTVFVEKTQREVFVNGGVPSGRPAASQVTQMAPGDRAELGMALAARNAGSPAGESGVAAMVPAKDQLAYTTVMKLQTGDLSGVALEHLSRQTESALRAIEAIRANGGDAEVVSFIENLTPEVAAQVKAQEEQAAAAAAAESEGTNAVYQKNQTAKAERNGVEDKVTNTWGIVTGDAGSQAASQGTGTRYQGAVLVGECEHGKVTTNVDQWAYEGDTVTVTVTPDPGYVLEELYYDNAGHPGSLYRQIPPKNGVYSFTMPGHGVKICATFVLPGQLYVSILPMLDQHGKLEADKTGMVRAGQTVTVTATPDAHYTAETVYYRYTYDVYDLSGEIAGTEKDTVILTPVDGVYRFTVPNAKSLEIGATFRELTTHAVVIDSDIQHGTVRADKTGFVYEGDTVTLTVTPDDGYVIDSVYYDYEGGSFDIVPVNGVYSFVVPNVPALVIHATFKEGVEYRIFLPDAEHGQVWATSYGGSNVKKAAEGDYVSVNFKGDIVDKGQHYSASGVTATWGTDGTPVDFMMTVRGGDPDTGAVSDGYIFMMPAGDVTFTGEFVPCYAIEINTSEGGSAAVSKVGSLSMSAERDPYAASGETVLLTVEPEEGYEVSTVILETGAEWEIVGLVDDVHFGFTMSATDVTVSVDFEKAETPTAYPITADLTMPGGYSGGTVSIQVDGEEVTEAASGDEVAVIFTAPAVNGQIYGVSSTTAKKNGTGSSFLTADVGGVTYDKEKGLYVSKHHFTMADGPVTVAATFEPFYEGTLNLTTVGNGSGSVSTYFTGAKVGENEYLRLAPEGREIMVIPSGGTITALSVAFTDDMSPIDYGPGATEGSYSFTMPAAPVTVDVELTYNGAQTEYDLKVAEGLSNGSISFMVGDQLVTKAAEGATVTMLVEPDEGYVASSYSCTKADGTAVELAATDDGLFFTMPGQAVTATAVFTADTPATEYDLKVAEGLSNGSIHFTVGGETVTKAAEGATVTLVAEPDEGYVAVNPSCAKANGDLVELTAGEDGVWTFTMPGEAVVASAVFTSGETARISLASDLAAAAEEHGFTVSYLDGDGNQLDPAEVEEGESVSVVLTGSSDSGVLYGASGVTASGLSAASGLTRHRTVNDQTGAVTDTFSFAMPEGNVVLSGGVARLYNVVCAASDPGSIWIASAGGFDYSSDKPTSIYCAAGENVYLGANGGESYKLVRDSIRVKYGEGYAQELQVSGGEYTYSKHFEMPASDASVSGQFDPSVRIYYSVNGNGGIRGSIGDEPTVKAFPGDVVTLTAEPNSGYGTRVVKVSYGTNDSQSWPVSPTEDPNVWTFTAPDLTTTTQVSARAEFAEPHTVTVADGIEHGTVTVVSRQPQGVTTVLEVADLANTVFFQGDTITLTITPDGAYQVKTGPNDGDGPHYTEAGSPSIYNITQQQDGTWTFQMPGADVTATAAFEQAYTIGTPTLDNGTIRVYRMANDDWTEITDTTKKAAEEEFVKVEFAGDHDETAGKRYAISSAGVCWKDTQSGREVFCDGEWEQRVNSDGQVVRSFCFTMPAHNVDVVSSELEASLTFRECYTVTAADGTGGTNQIESVGPYALLDDDHSKAYAVRGDKITLELTGSQGMCPTGVGLTAGATDAPTVWLYERKVTDTQNVIIVSTYAFDMPSWNVTATAVFAAAKIVPFHVDLQQASTTAPSSLTVYCRFGMNSELISVTPSYTGENYFVANLYSYLGESIIFQVPAPQGSGLVKVFRVDSNEEQTLVNPDDTNWYTVVNDGDLDKIYVQYADSV